MNKKILIIICFAVILIVGFVYFEFFGKEEPEPILQNGLVVISPKPNEEISSPLKITGYVNGDGWIGFEGQVGTVRLLDNEGKELSFGILTATTDWMEPSINFEANLEFQNIESISGTLIFTNENPSGLPENNQEFILPIKIKRYEGETTQVKVYFNNENMDPEFSCNKVFAVERTIPRTEAVAMASLRELLKGPTEAEKSEGYFISINPGVKIQSLNIDSDGLARVDFDEQLEFQVGGSCWVAAIRAEITQTLKQFPTIKDVIISINGRTEDILQP